MPSAVRRIDFVKEDYGWFVFASSLKQEFDSLALSPTHLDMTSLVLTMYKVDLIVDARTLAKGVLPVPGGP